MLQSVTSHNLPPSSDLISGCFFYLKMEHKQRTGSFKLRGAHSKLSLLSNTGHSRIVTASTGNHGLACLDAMSYYNVKGKIAVPETIAQVIVHCKFLVIYRLLVISVKERQVDKIRS